MLFCVVVCGWLLVVWLSLVCLFSLVGRWSSLIGVMVEIWIKLFNFWFFKWVVFLGVVWFKLFDSIVVMLKLFEIELDF